MTELQPYPPELSRAIAGIGADSVHGAGCLAVSCLDLLTSGADMLAVDPAAEKPDDFLRALAGRLSACQPAMCMIPNLLARVLNSFFAESGSRTGDAASWASVFQRVAAEEKKRLEREHEILCAGAAAFLAQRVPAGGRIATISHSRAVLGVIESLAAHRVRVTVSESRPLNEGVELARRLAGLGVEVRLIPDCLLGLATRGADAVLIGADSLTPGGDVVNKAGSRLLALAAAADGVPTYCCAETLKLMTAGPGPESLFPEQRLRPAAEVVDPPPEGVEVLNLYFELTEAALVSGYLTERGVLGREELPAISSELEQMVRKNIRQGR